MSKQIYPKFDWWIGVVEDRMDPEKMGRVRVRIYGYHTPDKSVLPTKDLPWAFPIQPITSGAISGIGSSPLGPLPGTWVIGFFLDGEDMQQPAFFGTFASKFTGFFFKTDESPKPSVNINDGILRDPKTNEPILDADGNPQLTAIPPTPGWELGQTSEKYESGGRGPGTINNYKASNDAGGASYGTYQLASFLPATRPDGKSRSATYAKDSPVLKYLATSGYGSQFSGLTPGTDAFDAKWKEIAAKDPANFKKSQHDYIQRVYYEPMVSKLKSKGILDANNHGPAVKDLIWSTAVQFGPGETSLFEIPLQGKKEKNDEAIVRLVSQYKISQAPNYRGFASAGLVASVQNRYKNEEADLVKLASNITGGNIG